MKDSNAPDVKTNLVLRARFNREYEEININDLARVFKKKQKYSELKEHV